MANTDKVAIDNLTIDNPMKLLTLSVKIPKSLPVRMWAAKSLFRLGAWIVGCAVSVEVAEATSEPPVQPRRRPF